MISIGREVSVETKMCLFEISCFASFQLIALIHFRLHLTICIGIIYIDVTVTLVEI